MKTISTTETTIVSYFTIQTERKIKSNKPEIIVKVDKKNAFKFLCQNSLKAYDRVSKYKDLAIDIKKMWHMKTNVPIIVWALGMMKKGTH